MKTEVEDGVVEEMETEFRYACLQSAWAPDVRADMNGIGNSTIEIRRCD